jgi:hypothetical protein
MAKITWKEGLVISIETQKKEEGRKENIYVLAQMLSRVSLLVFNIFRSDENWGDVDLNKVPVLFCTSVTKQFITQSHISKQDIKPLQGFVPPAVKLHPLGIGFRSVIVFKGTSYEKEVLINGDGGGQLIEEDMTSGSFQTKVLMSSVPSSNNKIIDQYELTNVRIYAEFNERLYLCYKLKKNVDPMKDLIFDRPIPLEYKEYIDIITS